MTSIINILEEKINKIKKEKFEYNNLLKNATTITGLLPMKTNNKQLTDYKIKKITDSSPDINKNKAIIINKLIPIEETYLHIAYTKEILTNKEYYIVLTNKYIWIINTAEYIIYNYPETPICEIIKNILMGKIIRINNILLEINGNKEKIEKFINIINDQNYRKKIIKEETKYLCGIIPTIQLINEIKSGMSIDINHNIVFHNKKDNYKCNIKQIKDYEILLDNTTVYSKQLETTNKIISNKNECYSITLQVKIDNDIFIMPILEPNSLNTKYTPKDKAYQESINFINNIITYLKLLEKNN